MDNNSNTKSNNDKKRNRVLFDFESLVDIKLSAIRKIITETKGYPVQEFELNGYKLKRMYSDILKDVDISDVDLEHPEYPVFTSMKSLLEGFLTDGNGIINPKVLCKDRIQQRIIKETFPEVKTLVGPRSLVKTLNFARIIVGNAKHILEFKDPITVDFMVLNFRENFADDDISLLDKEVVFQVGDVNRFTIAKAYTEIHDPVG